MAGIYEFKIGTTLVGMVNVEDLITDRLGALPAPQAIWQPYAELITLGDNSVAGIGAPICTWRFGEVSAAQRNALRVFCPGPSAPVFIRTMVNDLDAYANYSAIMVWPLIENRDAYRRLNLDITFQQLIGA